MNVSMIPTIASPARGADTAAGAALPGFGDLLGGATTGIAPVTIATAADARGVLPQPQLVTGVPQASAPIAKKTSSEFDVESAADAAALPDGTLTAPQMPPPEDAAIDSAAMPSTELAASPSPQPQPQAKPVAGEHEQSRPEAAHEGAVSSQQLAMAQPVALIAPVETPVVTAPEESEVPAAPTESEAQTAAPDDMNIDLPVQTLPEAARPAQSGPDANLPIAAPVVPPPIGAAEAAPNDKVVAQDIALADNAAAPKAETVPAGGGAATSAADAARTVAGDGATDMLPSQLFSQALANPAPRPAGQPYPAAASQVPHQPVVTAKPGQIGRDMGVEIARQVSAGKEEVLIRLDPAEMGRIEVRLSFDREGSLRAVMAADSPAALDMLRREAGDLSRALTDAGVRADTQSFRFDSRSNDPGQAWQRGQQGGDARGGQGGLPHDGGDSTTDEPVYQPLRASGRVDLMA